MKKLFSLFCVALASATLLAIPTAKLNKAVDVRNDAPRATFMQSSEEVDKTLINATIDALSAKKAIAEVETDTTVAYYAVRNQFTTGPAGGDYGYVSFAAYIIAPFSDTVTFYNGWNVSSTPEWEVGDLVATGESFSIETGEFNEEYDLPTLKYNPATVSTSDTTARFFYPYKFANQYISFYKSKYPSYNWRNKVCMAPEYACMAQYGYYSEFDKYGSGWGLYGGGSWAPNKYGTGIVNPFIKPDTIITPDAGGGDPDTTLAYHYFDTVMSVINNSETLWVNYVTVGVHDYPSGTYFPDQNTRLTMTVLPLKEDKSIDWANPLAVGYADSTGLTDAGEGWYGSLRFNFYKTDAAGMVKRVPLIADGDFVVLISGFNQPGVSIGLMTDCPYDDAPTPQTYFAFEMGGKIYTDKFWPRINSATMNIAINFLGLWPNIQGLPEVINVPLAGGTTTVTLPTNVWAEDMDIFADDWIEIEAESQAENPGTDDEEFLYKVDATITIEEADAAREGLIEIDALGKIYQIVVKQGSTTAVENVTKKINDNKLYNVLGIEVDENYKGVVIRNGEKFLQ